MTVSLSLSLLFITLLSTDAFICGFSYGMNRVRISPLYIFIISFFSSLILTLSYLSGAVISRFLPTAGFRYLSFLLLLLLSLYKLYDALSFLHKPQKKEPAVSHLSIKEAVLLALVISIDNLTAGICIDASQISIVPVFVYSLLVHLFAVCIGWYLGHCLSMRCSRSLALLSAILLFILSILQLL